MHLRALFAQRNDNSVGVTRSPDIFLVFTVNSVYCYYESPSVVYSSALENRAVHRETEAMAAEEEESDYEYPERETTTEEKPSKDEYPVRDMIRMEEDSFEDEYPETEMKAEEKSEDEYLKKTEEAEASKFWDFKHEKDFFPDSIAEEEEMVEYDEEIAGSTAQNIAAAIAELFPIVNDDESETDIEGWVPVPPLKPSDIDKVVVSDDKFERFILLRKIRLLVLLHAS